MKSSDFKRRPSEIRVIKEGKPKKKVNWDKIIYLSILGVASFFLIRFLFYYFLFASGEGQVLFETLDIQLYNDSQIQKFICSEGDTIKAGDTLFTYIDENKLNNNFSNSVNNTNWKSKEKLRVEQEINLKKIEISKFEQLLGELKKDKDRVQKEIYLDVYTADKLDPYIKQITDFKLRIKALEKEVELLKEIQSKIDTIFSEDTTSSINIEIDQASLAGQNPFNETFISPINGIISHIFKKNFETVLQNEHVMSVHDPSSNVYIRVFFEQSDIRHLHRDDLVSVEFANGKKTKGRINRFYFDSYELPIQFKKLEEDFIGDIEVSVVPLTEADEKVWRECQKLEVVVRKQKFL